MKKTIDITNPDLSKEWIDEKSMSNFTHGSKYKALWLCLKCRCEYRSIIHNRTLRGSGCPCCAGQKIVVGHNDLATQRPDVAIEVSTESALSARDVTVSSTKELIWECSFGHKYRMKVNGKTNYGYGCPYCSGKKLLEGKLSLKEQYPEVAEELISEIDPEKLHVNSNLKLEWKCKNKGHTWSAVVSQRTRRGNGCPYCSGRRVSKGENDILTLFPELINNEWNDEKVPDNFAKWSHYEASWKCINKHMWKATIFSRVMMGRGCPKCYQGTSKIEDMLRKYIKSITSHLILSRDRKIISPLEIDIYIPSLNIAFEFNGNYWHSNEYSWKQYGMSAKNRHQRKKDLCNNAGIDLYFVWEEDWVRRRDFVKLSIQKVINSKARREHFEILSKLEGDPSFKNNGATYRKSIK